MNKFHSFFIVIALASGTANGEARPPKLTFRILAYASALATRAYFGDILDPLVRRYIDVVGGSILSSELLSAVLNPHHCTIPHHCEAPVKNQAIATGGIALAGATLVTPEHHVSAHNTAVAAGAGVAHAILKTGPIARFLNSPIPYIG